MGRMETDAERLARRYPARRSPLADWRLWAVLLGAIGLGWVGWVALEGAVPPVSARVDAFRAVSDTEFEVTVAVEREDLSRGAQCLLFVQAVSYERVGEVDLTVARRRAPDPADGHRPHLQARHLRHRRGVPPHRLTSARKSGA